MLPLLLSTFRFLTLLKHSILFERPHCVSVLGVRFRHWGSCIILVTIDHLLLQAPAKPKKPKTPKAEVSFEKR